MKVSGFTLCRNGVRLGFPFRESLRSLAPLCDEIVLALGRGEDNTEEEIQKLAATLPCPLRIIHTEWDPASVKGGSILAEQTNIALEACAHDIVFYLQGDEVLHEEDTSILKADLERLEKNPDAASMVLQWVHFFGDSKSVAYSRKWYRKEIRAFKKSSGLKSYKDAQSFRKYSNGEWSTLPAIESKARVLHYGWARPADLMALKHNDFQQWWHGTKGSIRKEGAFPHQFGINPYEGTHPLVMREYLAAMPQLDQPFYQINRTPFSLESLRIGVSHLIEKATGYRPGEFKSYSRIV